MLSETGCLSGFLFYSNSRLYAIHFDLSPKRREALNLTPLSLEGKGLGVRPVFHAIENHYICKRN